MLIKYSEIKREVNKLPKDELQSISFPGAARAAAHITRKKRLFAAASLPRLFGNNVPGHTTRAPPVGFELAINGIQFYAIANLDKIMIRTYYV